MTMNSSRPYLVRALYEWINDNRCTPYLLVDATYPGVQVPQSYVQDGRIVLNIAPGAIAALEMANDEIRFSARFSGRPMQLYVPIGAVLGIYARENGEGMLFDPMPLLDEEEDDELGLDEIETESREADDTPPKRPSGRPALRVVK